MRSYSFMYGCGSPHVWWVHPRWLKWSIFVLLEGLIIPGVPLSLSPEIHCLRMRHCISLGCCKYSFSVFFFRTIEKSNMIKAAMTYFKCIREAAPQRYRNENTHTHTGRKEDEYTWSHLESPPPRTSFSLSSRRRARWLIWQWGRWGIFPPLHLLPYLHPSHLWTEKKEMSDGSYSHLSFLIFNSQILLFHARLLGVLQHICATEPKFNWTPSNCWAAICVILFAHDPERPGSLRKCISVTVKHNCWWIGGDQ